MISIETNKKQSTEIFIKEIRRKTRRIFTSEQKITIVMDAIRAELSVAEICRKYFIKEAQFYRWNKEFIEEEKKRLAGDTTREATSDDVADLVIRYDIVKKAWKFWNERAFQQVHEIHRI